MTMNTPKEKNGTTEVPTLQLIQDAEDASTGQVTMRKQRSHLLGAVAAFMLIGAAVAFTTSSSTRSQMQSLKGAQYTPEDIVVGPDIVRRLSLGSSPAEVPGTRSDARVSVILTPSPSQSPSISSSPSAMPSVSAAPSASSAPSEAPTTSSAPSQNPSAAPSKSPSQSPSSQPSSAPSDSPTMAPKTFGTIYFIAYQSTDIWGCDKARPAITASCSGNGRLVIMEHAKENHSCVMGESDQTMVCTNQEESYIQVRCETLGYNPNDLVLTVNLPSEDLTCDACADAGNCDVYIRDRVGKGFSRLFVFTGCEDQFITLGDTCTGTVKLDQSAVQNRYCEAATSCQTPDFGATCDATLPANTVTTSLFSQYYGQCIYPMAH